MVHNLKLWIEFWLCLPSQLWFHIGQWYQGQGIWRCCEDCLICIQVYVPQMITLFSNGPAPEQGGWVFKSLCLTDSFECNLDPMSKKGLSSVVLVVKFDKNKKAEKCSCTPNDQNSQWNFEIPVWIWIIWLFMMDLWCMMPCWSHSKLKIVVTAGVN